MEPALERRIRDFYDAYGVRKGRAELGVAGLG
jgi:hypothetical protein